MDTEIATEGINSDLDTLSGSMLAEMMKERHALFDDVTTARRDGDDLPEERGVTGKDLCWTHVLGDSKLDKRVRNTAWRVQRKHPFSNFDAEDLAQRIRWRLVNGAAIYKEKNGLPKDTKLVFELDRGWTKYAQTIIKNECARYVDRMERECKEHMLLVSRDGRGEKDADGDEMSWRENLDLAACWREFDHDQLQIAVEAAIAEMHGLSRWLIEAYYRDGIGQRTLAKSLKMPLSSFQNGPWKRMKEEFLANFNR